MVKGKELLVDKDRMYVLVEAASGDLFLKVLCGGFAMEWAVLQLTPQEIGDYQERGKDALDDLARQVAHRRSEFKDRLVDSD